MINRYANLNNSMVCGDLNELAYLRLLKLLENGGGKANWPDIYLVICRNFSIDKQTARKVIGTIKQKHPELKINKRGITLNYRVLGK